MNMPITGQEMIDAECLKAAVNEIKNWARGGGLLRETLYAGGSSSNPSLSIHLEEWQSLTVCFNYSGQVYEVTVPASLGSHSASGATVEISTNSNNGFTFVKAKVGGQEATINRIVGTRKEQ